MAATFTESKRGPEFLGRRQLHVGKITLDASYPTGGYSIPLSVLKAQNARAIEGATILGGNAAANAYKFHWDTTNNKLMAAWTGAAINSAFAEVANVTNLSAVVLDVMFVLV